MVGILNRNEILELCQQGMITPFHAAKIRVLDGRDVLSLGLDVCGYDISGGYEVLFPRPGVVLDPKRPDPTAYNPAIGMAGQPITIPPHTAFLTHSLETFQMPTDVMAIAYGKSSYARVFLTPLVTPLEPGWSGELVIEVSNNSPCPVQYYPGEGLVSLRFLRFTPTEARYESKHYQNQKGIRLAEV